MPTLYLIRGVPGSGKSTLAKKMIDSGMAYFWGEADHFFENEDGYDFNPKLLHQAHFRCQDRTIFYLKQNKNVVVSNTSTTEKEVETYRQIALTCGADFVSIVVENRHEGKNLHDVPEDKIQQMKNRFSLKL